MYYLWKRKFSDKKQYFSCGLTNGFTRSKGYMWQIKGIDKKIEAPLKYEAMNNLTPGDFPIVNSGKEFFLISDRVKEVLGQFNRTIQFFPSEIIKKNGEVVTGYSTANILDRVACADLEASEHEYDDLFESYFFDSLRLDHEKIPEGTKIFWLKEDPVLLIVHQDVADALEELSISDVHLMPVEEYAGV